MICRRQLPDASRIVEPYRVRDLVFKLRINLEQGQGMRQTEDILFERGILKKSPVMATSGGLA